MSGTTRSFSKAGALALSLAVVGLISSAAHAASISYGNFGPVPPGVSFLGVTETSVTDGVPLYGPPVPYSVGLDFNPAGFVATSTGGGADLTDGQLNFSVSSAPNVGIFGINLSEAGDYTLAGIGTSGTQVQAGAILRATITQINGVNVAPINLPPVQASIGANLAANAGIVQPWSVGLFQPINLPQGQLATRIDVVINNSLLAVSEPNSIAFIAKKDFQIDVDTTIPEPTSVALATLALCGLGVAARKR